MGIPTRTTNVSIWCKQHFPQLLKGNKEYTYHSSWILMRRISNLTSKESSSRMSRLSRLEWRISLCENHVLVFARITCGVTTVRKDPAGTIQWRQSFRRWRALRVYSLSFSRHNKNIKMEHFFLYILSRYFIWLHKMKRVLMISVHH